MAITVLVADDASVVRKAIRELLEGEPEIEIVGEAADYAQALDMTNGLKPQVVVMDLHMPDGKGASNGNDCAPPDIKSYFANGSRLLAVSLWDDDETKALAATCGAATLLDKTKLYSQLVPAIKQLFRGG